jgi:hypothetical protein
LFTQRYFRFLSIEALSDALRSWGGKDGAIIVVSHDKSFCDSVGFNTVGTVSDGTITVEERDLNDSDWKRYAMSAQGGEVGGAKEEKEVAKPLTPEEKEALKQKRKQAFNAPKRIKKLEKMIETSEMKIAELDEQMMQVGSDVGKLTDLSNDKQKEEANVAKYMEEWEELEELLAEIEEASA